MPLNSFAFPGRYGDSPFEGVEETAVKAVGSRGRHSPPKLFLPQICHKEFQTDSENGGFRRFCVWQKVVAKMAPKGHFFTYYSAKSLKIKW